jgi:hypothetical protein
LRLVASGLIMEKVRSIAIARNPCFLGISGRCLAAPNHEDKRAFSNFTPAS